MQQQNRIFKKRTKKDFKVGLLTIIRNSNEKDYEFGRGGRITA
jgi:hypothetical protein